MLTDDQAATYSSCFASLSDPTRVKILHTVASQGPLGIGDIATVVGVSQPTASHHVKLLAGAGFVGTHKNGTATVVTVNQACCTGLPHAADAVMGALDTLPCCVQDLPTDVSIRPMTTQDVDEVRRIYAEGIATGQATFETEVPSWQALDRRWLPDHRFVASFDGEVAGWACIAPVSERSCYRGVGESSIYVARAHRGRRVGVALIDQQVRAADASALWTLQAAVFPENTASLRLHRAAGFRTVGVRERIAVREGSWRDTVLLERRRPR